MDEKSKVKFVKHMYGLQKFEDNDTILFGTKIIIGWYICGYSTLKDLEDKFTDEEILSFYEQ